MGIAVEVAVGGHGPADGEGGVGVQPAGLLRELFPDLKMRVVNIVDLMTLQPKSEHPHGLSDRDFDAIFTRGVS